MHRITLNILGTTVLDLQVGRVEPATPERETPDAAPGPVTDRRAAPTLGFAASATLPRDRRPVVR
jgi:hypothetical protein